MDTGIQLGRRFRSLKLWMLLRHVGAERLRALLREHIRLARVFAEWVDAHPDFERLAPVPFSVVCFRAVPSGRAWDDDRLDAFNQRLIDAVNAEGNVFLSHTRLGDRLVLRLAIGNLRTTELHVGTAWDALQRHAAALSRLDPP
jgi:aromatic-L-amino-acid decarboxylase